MWSELLAELAEVMPTLPDGERAQAWLRIARLYGDKLNAAEYALTSLDEALKLDADARRRGRAAHRRSTSGSSAGRELAMALRRRRSGSSSRPRCYESRLGDGVAGGGGVPQGAARRSRLRTRRARRWRRCCAGAASGARWPRCSTSACEYATGEEARALQGGGGGAVRRSARRSQAGDRALRGARRRRRQAT